MICKTFLAYYLSENDAKVVWMDETENNVGWNGWNFKASRSSCITGCIHMLTYLFKKYTC